MCGIVGIVRADPQAYVDRERLEAMAASLAHRGPDGVGVFTAPGIGLASRRLAIIDPAGGGQPLQNEDGSLVAVYNGEIYNFRELRTSLERKGHRFRSDTDGEVLCHLYEEEGERMLSRLRGMFAFALWDARAHRLVLARDRFGVKPLYYAPLPGGLAFASELKALLTLPELSRDLDPVALADYLTYLYIPAPSTIFAGARKLGAGACLAYGDGRADVGTWWEPPPPGTGTEALPADAPAELLERLRETVRAHLVADVPVGAFLSGGLDSSTVVALMAEVSPHPVRTFTVGFEEAGVYDERAAARLVARRFGCEHTEVVAAASVGPWLPRLAGTFDEPFADSSAIPTFLVSEAASRKLPVVLSGDGGDELLCGYEWYRYHQLLRSARTLPRPLRAALARRAAARLPENGRAVGAWARACRLVADAALEPRDRYLRRITCFGDGQRERVVPWAAHGSGIAAAFYDGPDGTTGPVERMAYADLRLGLPDDMLTKVDRTSMAHGLEVRVPLLDHELAGFLWSLPTSQKLRRLETKRLLRTAVRSILPVETLAKRKQGFGVPVGTWLRNDPGSWRPLLERSRASAEGYLRGGVALELADRHLAGAADLGHQLWALLVFEVWWRLRTEGGEVHDALVLADLI